MKVTIHLFDLFGRLVVTGQLDNDKCASLLQHNERVYAYQNFTNNVARYNERERPYVVTEF